MQPGCPQPHRHLRCMLGSAACHATTPPGDVSPHAGRAWLGLSASLFWRRWRGPGSPSLKRHITSLALIEPRATEPRRASTRRPDL